MPDRWIGRFDLGHLVAQIAHPLTEATFGTRARHLGFDLIEQCHQLATER